MPLCGWVLWLGALGGAKQRPPYAKVNHAGCNHAILLFSLLILSVCVYHQFESHIQG